jgi:two-component system NtrC family sensor kinase
MGRILVVDDDAQVRGALARILAREHAVEEASGGREALARIAAGERYDAILCDMMMPDVSGMAFHAALAERSPELVGRVAFMTGAVFTEEQQRFLDTVPNPRVEKPFDVAEVRALVAALSGGGGRAGR